MEQSLSKERALQLVEKLTLYYEACLQTNPEAVNYVRNIRGFSDETIRTYRLGYAPKDVLRGHFTPTELDFLVELAHIREVDETDPFAERIIFPILDVSGRPRGFSGRLIEVGSRPDKYYNSKANLVFKKGLFVFGLYQAREQVFYKNKALVCEGFTDIISARQAGYPISVSAMGVYLTKEHLLEIAKFTKNLYFLFDGDAAGSLATKRSLETARSMGFSCNFFTLPEGMDPDDYFRMQTGNGTNISTKQ